MYINKARISYQMKQYDNIMTGRIQTLPKICICEKDYILNNIYGPNENSLQFYQYVDTYLESVEDETFDNRGVIFNTIFKIQI